MRRQGGGWNQEVTDAQGRRRFHGAFTGGFSAGYYNTVGSEEGWTPSTFTSSRARRSTGEALSPPSSSSSAVKGQRPEDFMDEDDDPLLGRRLETADKYDTLQGRQRQQLQAHAATAGGRTSSVWRVPDELILPATESIGMRLLRNMGWKDGHGIGPRIRRRRRSLTGEEDPGEEPQELGANERDDEGNAVVCYLPPRTTIDVRAFPEPKLDKYGAGFDPFVNAPEFSLHKKRQREVHDQASLPRLQQQQQQSPNRVLTFADALQNHRPQTNAGAFGLGALEDNDDVDVYDAPSMQDFDRTIGPAETIRLLDSAAQESKKRVFETRTVCADGRPALPGFRIASKADKPPRAVIERLDVPSNFRAHHVFDQKNDATVQTQSIYAKFDFSTEKGGRQCMMTAKQRAAILNEDSTNQAPKGSVFDMLDAAGRDRLRQIAEAAKDRKPLTSSTTSDQFRANISASIAKRFVSASKEEDSPGEDSTLGPAVKKSYRTEDQWAPHSLLCKRFHVKCQGPTISGSDAVEEAQDLFSTELAPHLINYAAEKSANNAKKAVDRPVDENLEPLPPTSRPPANLLKSIFEPSSDESALDESSSDDNSEGANVGAGVGNDRDNEIPDTGQQELSPAARGGTALPLAHVSMSLSDSSSSSDDDDASSKISKEKKAKKSKRVKQKKEHHSSSRDKKKHKRKESSKSSRRRDRSRSHERDRTRKRSRREHRNDKGDDHRRSHRRSRSRTR